MTSSDRPRRTGPADNSDDDYTGARYEDEAMALANKGRGRQPPRPGSSRSYTRKTPSLKDMPTPGDLKVINYEAVLS